MATSRPFQVFCVLQCVVGCCSPSKLGLVKQEKYRQQDGNSFEHGRDYVTTGVPGFEVLCGGFDCKGTGQPRG